jgi:probable rRNA maturation factor
MSNILFESLNDFRLHSEDYLDQWLSGIILSEGKELGELSYFFCSDDYLLALNMEHLDHDTYTDIITFDYCEGDVVHSDIFVSTDRVKENAETNNVSFEEELHRVMVHGILHLLGQGDKTEAEALEMKIKENASLKTRPKSLLSD